MLSSPFKVIHKYKNLNGKYQYHVNIFVGNVDKDVMAILQKIKNYNLYDAITKISKQEHTRLVEQYGEKWYIYFFNHEHINFSIHMINGTNAHIKNIVSKYGQEWYDEHIKSYSVNKKILYNYSTSVKLYFERKSKHGKIEEQLESPTQSGGYDDIQTLLNNYIPNNNQIGGSDEQVLNINDVTMDNIIVDDNTINVNEDMMDKIYDDAVIESDNTIVENIETLDSINDVRGDDELDMNELEQLYKGNDVQTKDNNINKTNEMIKDLFTNNIYDKIENNISPFDTSKDTANNDDKLKNIYNKTYITTQYILEDDTIKNVKNKICCSIMNHPAYGEFNKILPSRQYLWSEYTFNNNTDSLMIGHKWLQRNELLSLQIVPDLNIKKYEELRGSELNKLFNDLRRTGGHIKMEDDDTNILNDYKSYYTNNEIMMLDIYNELGLKYHIDNEKSINNLYYVYIQIYFPHIKRDELSEIIEYLNINHKLKSDDNKQMTNEEQKIKEAHNTLLNDLILENDVMYIVEKTKLKKNQYTKYFEPYNIIQSHLHVQLQEKQFGRFDLRRIFDQFILNEEYPFMQFHGSDGRIYCKFNKEELKKIKQNNPIKELVLKWFVHSPFGLSFKIKSINNGIEKYISVGLSENGRMEFKANWSEEVKADVNNINETYNHIIALIEKVNKECTDIKIKVPLYQEFEYSFINCIQKFSLPKNSHINHNHLSEFSRLFFPYISLVIEPRKRTSKKNDISDKSKYGTYLRYKRISKYENIQKVEQRILYILKNYDVTDAQLLNEISKQFNLTREKAETIINETKLKYPTIRKVRKIAKTLDGKIKHVSFGIGVDIVGKQPKDYKMRLSGIRNIEQLETITQFLNVLIFLYIQTYLLKVKEYGYLKDNLKKLINVANRRNKVDVYLRTEDTLLDIKKKVNADPTRLKTSSKDGYARLCQSSGEHRKRGPQQYQSKEDILKLGFKYNPTLKLYEKMDTYKGKKVKIYSIELKDYDEDGNSDSSIFYTCNPKDNGSHMYVGFLSKTSSVTGKCMPCCFKRPQYTDNKKDFFNRCLKDEDITNMSSLTVQKKNTIYLLRDSNKLYDGKIGYLSKYMDYFFNTLLNKDKIINGYTLIGTNSGYYVKRGVNRAGNIFMNVISFIFGVSDVDIYKRIEDKIKDDTIYMSLNNGEIYDLYNKKSYIEDIKNPNNVLSIIHILTYPGIITDNGLNIIVFEKQNVNGDYIDDYKLYYINIEEISNLSEPSRETIIMIKDGLIFYPVTFITFIKNKFQYNYKFKYEDTSDNVVKHILSYINKNIELYANFADYIEYTSKNVYKRLISMGYKPISQYINNDNKVKYLEIKDGLIPVYQSGVIYDLKINNNKIKLENCAELITKYKKLSDVIGMELEPIGIYYDIKTDDMKGDIKYIIGIMLKSKLMVPCKNEVFVESKFKGMIFENIKIFDDIDELIKDGTVIHDDRIKTIRKIDYERENYQLYRYHLSDYLSREPSIKKKLIELIESDINKKDKEIKIKRILYKLVDDSLLKLFNDKYGKSSDDITVKDKMLNIIQQQNTDNYAIDNIRKLCGNKSKHECTINCAVSGNKCKFASPIELVIRSINRVTEELLIMDNRASEILQLSNYHVSSIANLDNYIQRPGQVILRNTNNNSNDILQEIFENNIPDISYKSRKQQMNVNELNAENKLIDMGEYKIQKIIPNNSTLLRCYVNGYNWIKYRKYSRNANIMDNLDINLKYYSLRQTELLNYFRGSIIDWILKQTNNKYIKELISKKYIEYDINTYKSILMAELEKTVPSGNGIIELYILNKIHGIPIIVYDNNNISYIINDNIIYHYKYNKNDKILDMYNTKKELKTKSINIQITKYSVSGTPLEASILYY